MAPEDPTSAPVIIKAVFSSVNPIPAAAHPEYEFNIEITTGISAPPIGIIRRKPIKKEANNNTQKYIAIVYPYKTKSKAINHIKKRIK